MTEIKTEDFTTSLSSEHELKVHVFNMNLISTSGIKMNENHKASSIFIQLMGIKNTLFLCFSTRAFK